MKQIRLLSLFSIALILLAFDLPKGWIKAGSQRDKYDMGIDKNAGKDGSNAATIKSLEDTIKGFGTLSQTCLPDHFKGKRVRMSGLMKTKDVGGWAGLWLRVDPNLGFDNMHDGYKDLSVKGTSDWKKYEIVLDVPECATNLAYGALLDGTGQIWFDDFKFEIVDSTVQLTGLSPEIRRSMQNPHNNPEPMNLNFEE